MPDPHRTPKSSARALWQLWRDGRRPDLAPFVEAASALSPSQLVDVIRVDQRERWSIGDRVSAAAYLRDFSLVRSHPEAAFELVYGEFLLREELGEAPALAEYVRAYPQHEARLRLQLDLHRALQSNTIDGDKSASELYATLANWSEPTEDARQRRGSPPAVAGYEILGEIGRGGMGVVYRARQLGLNRDIALKMILAGDHAGPDAMSRFFTEAEAIARLQHPNIVQVHHCGGHDDRPFLVMEYVEGGSLAQTLDGTPRPIRAAVLLVQQLAAGIALAHRKGIVHRDLKPANVLLTLEGAPKIADFGLAKILETDSRLTGTDAILGTAAYMAPEQAGGRNQTVGLAADVYSLGTILYELLTGRAPFKAASALETLELVRLHEAVPPGRLRPELTKDIETICLKCLAKEPERRYQTADDLEEDLRRFLAGESIRARRASIIERGMRWCRRNPALAALTAAMTFALVAGFVASTTQWYRAERHLRAEERQRKRAEKNLALEAAARAAAQRANTRERAARQHAQAQLTVALDAIKTFHTGVSEEVLLKEPRLEQFRNHLLSSALKLYGRLKADMDQDTDPLAPAELADAYARLGSLMSSVGSLGDALSAYQKALELREAMARAAPVDRRIQAELARVIGKTAYVCRELDRWDEAERLYQRSLAMWESLCRACPGDPDPLREAAWSHANLGAIHLFKNQPREALRQHQQALAIRQNLLLERPDEPSLQSEFASIQFDLALAFSAAGRDGDALSAIQRSVEIQGAVLASHPELERARNQLGRALVTYGQLLNQAGRPADSLPHYRRALAILDRRARETPSAPFLQREIGLCRALIADALRAIGRNEEAIDELRQALARSEAAARQQPTAISFGREAANSHIRLAALLSRIDRDEEAFEEYRISMALSESMSASHPENMELRGDVEYARFLISDVRRKQGRLVEAVEWCERAVAMTVEDHGKRRNDTQYRWHLARSLLKLGALRAEAGRYAEAIEDQMRAVALRENLASTAPEDHSYVTEWATAIHMLGATYRSAGRATRALEAFRKARTILEQLPQPDATDLYNLACAWAGCRDVLEQRGEGMTDAELAEYSLAASRSMSALRRSVAAGYRNAFQIRSDPDFFVLHSQQDFRELIADLVIPRIPFVGGKWEERVEATTTLCPSRD
jgi:eukaryotic-like serine/threonine-protein kinase